MQGGALLQFRWRAWHGDGAAASSLLVSSVVNSWAGRGPKPLTKSETLYPEAYLTG